MKVEIIEYKPEYQKHFQALNEQWINHYFKLEPYDIDVLTNPEKYIIKNGGFILFAKFLKQIVGCIAMSYNGYGIYELNKMAVDVVFRNRGIGKELIETALERLKEKRAVKVVLASQKGLKSAIHLYESFGFEHATFTQLAHSRSDVYMELNLKPK
ncbi:GNAT family N-acetyltransferase [uncultured Psychroserpens sp.]|uniref:GNAT family N-acetyltransferase n=1 Tax=uncultured Psychroserpens sp. TaxID=255436 RepID=UPI002615E6F5|nr:GNAT family N-acetyltransferase [uncultured Psychroserpens sp.]